MWLSLSNSLLSRSLAGLRGAPESLGGAQESRAHGRRACPRTAVWGPVCAVALGEGRVSIPGRSLVGAEARPGESRRGRTCSAWIARTLERIRLVNRRIGRMGSDGTGPFPGGWASAPRPHCQGDGVIPEAPTPFKSRRRYGPRRQWGLAPACVVLPRSSSFRLSRGSTEDWAAPFVPPSSWWDPAASKGRDLIRWGVAILLPGLE